MQLKHQKASMQSFIEKVRVLQRDDHRYYHQCRINQSLHLFSAISFLVAYALLFIEPAAAGIVGWLVGMVSRQSGHIFFEPRGYDHLNGATDAYKESIKVGYNMRRKAVLISVWLLDPACCRAEGLDPRRRIDVVGIGRGRTRVSYGAPLLHSRDRVGIGLGLQDLAGPIPQRGNLLEIAICIDAGPAV
jgi:hypothetical protein